MPGVPGEWSTPSAVEALPWGSRSTTSTDSPPGPVRPPGSPTWWSCPRRPSGSRRRTPGAPRGRKRREAAAFHVKREHRSPAGGRQSFLRLVEPGPPWTGRPDEGRLGFRNWQPWVAQAPAPPARPRARPAPRTPARRAGRGRLGRFVGQVDRFTWNTGPARRRIGLDPLRPPQTGHLVALAPDAIRHVPPPVVAPPHATSDGHSPDASARGAARLTAGVMPAPAPGEAPPRWPASASGCARTASTSPTSPRRRESGLGRGQLARRRPAP